jgi:hypothetical protein
LSRKSVNIFFRSQSSYVASSQAIKHGFIAFAPTSKSALAECNHTTLSTKKKFKTLQSAGKVLLTAFCDTQGVPLLEFLDRWTTLNADRYRTETLEGFHLAETPWLAPRENNLPRQYPLPYASCHDAAAGAVPVGMSCPVTIQQGPCALRLPHLSSHHTAGTLRLATSTLAQSPYSRDLAPSDFNLFGPQ